MSALLLVMLGYSTASYIGSGSICYLLSQAPFSSNNLQKLVKLWVLFLWPIWIFQEINQDNSTPELSEQNFREKKLLISAEALISK